ncbi:MAG: DHH family phosphoesterase [Oscillospiraceae bacterium]|nr:DHH family phosphoesterase [Oscillospiraceae bacterium]
MKTVNELAKWLLEHDDYLILTHRRPDGDATGSAIALCLGLRAVGKTAHIWANPQFTPRYAERLDGLLTDTVTDETTVISVDMATEGLLPINGDRFEGKTRLSIDHHPSNTGYAAHTFLRSDSAACGEIVWELLEELGVTPTKEMAEAVYIAVSTDTGCFRFANTTARTFMTAAKAVEHGADIAPINRALFEIKSRGRLQLESRLMANMEFFADGTVAIACLPQTWVEELEVTEDDLDSISGFPRTVDGVQVSVLIRDSEPGRAKMSVRTAAGFDASRYCGYLGGGGHKAAAGCSVEGTLMDGKRAIMDVLKKENVI